jgi:hypothetical protein
MGTRQQDLFVIFDGPPGPTSGRFVEVEDAAGQSHRLGEWEQRLDGEWTLGPIAAFDDACLMKVKPGEPIFVLRAQDLLSPVFVRGWALAAQAVGLPKERFDEAMACAAAMEAWPNRKMPD